MPIVFRLLGQGVSIPSNSKPLTAFLNSDRWDDWGKYCTQFFLTVIDASGTIHEIGHVKIGQQGLAPNPASHKPLKGHRSPDIPDPFNELDEDFFSVGQDDDYYGKVSELGDDLRENILKSLRDVCYDESRWEWAKEEEVMTESLLRSVTTTTVTGQFRRMARGDARVTSYSFTYSPPKRLGDGKPPFELEFNVDPDSPIPTNVHVLIGRNGVGKTRLLSLMAKALVASEASAIQSGRFELNEQSTKAGKFANVVAVSFSVFDEGDLLPEKKLSPNGLGYSYIGIRDWTSKSPTASIKPKSLDALAKEFVESLRECRIGSRRKRWLQAMETLESDPVFSAYQITSMIDQSSEDDEESRSLEKTFKNLSSGHKIVLLTLTRLVQKVEERTLVLIDEPEAHLHPPLLSALTRAISELMVKRNGVAIIATHSPVILQEVPRSCVWILNRLFNVSKAERPTIETFAESVGILSREVFQLELTQSGFHQLLREISQMYPTYERAIRELNDELGAEGKAVLRAMYLDK